MTDAEFEVLMDQIHGKGKGPGSEGDKAAVQSHAAPAAGSTGSLAAKDIQTAPKAAPRRLLRRRRPCASTPRSLTPS